MFGPYTFRIGLAKAPKAPQSGVAQLRSNIDDPFVLYEPEH